MRFEGITSVITFHETYVHIARKMNYKHGVNDFVASYADIRSYEIKETPESKRFFLQLYLVNTSTINDIFSASMSEDCVVFDSIQYDLLQILPNVMSDVINFGHVILLDQHRYMPSKKFYLKADLYSPVRTAKQMKRNGFCILKILFGAIGGFVAVMVAFGAIFGKGREYSVAGNPVMTVRSDQKKRTLVCPTMELLNRVNDAIKNNDREDLAMMLVEGCQTLPVNTKVEIIKFVDGEPLIRFKDKNGITTEAMIFYQMLE